MDSKDGQARWGYSEFSRISSPFLSGVVDHMCIRIPRTAFRQCGITFSEIKITNQTDRYWEMAYQLFLEVLRRTELAGKDQENAELVMKYPFQKVYLQWIPSENDPFRAESYIIHAFLMCKELSDGYILSQILKDTDEMFFNNQNRTANSRKPDPLMGLQQHQHFHRVNTEIYYRNICGLVRGDRKIENNLDSCLLYTSPSPRDRG